MKRLLGGVGLVLVLGCGGIGSSTDDFFAEVSAPASVRTGETVEVRVKVYNTAAEQQTLHSLDIDDAIMAGFDVVSSSPPYRDFMHVPIDNTESYEYMRAIPAGGSVDVTLTLSAVKTGYFSGEIDVCVNGDARFNSYPFSMTVQ